MHKIDYEEFFKHYNKKDFEDDYLIALGWKIKNNGELHYTDNYNELNAKYKLLKDNYSWLCFILPSELDKLLLYEYENLVKLFINIYLMNGYVPDSFKNEIKECINYEKSYKSIKYSTRIRSFFSTYADDLSIHSCAYCETAYTGSYEIENNEGEKKDKGLFDLDHFFPKEEYPIFALCLYNFVPCCQVCNSKRIKGSTPLLKFYNIDKNNLIKAKEHLLQVSPLSKKYSFNNESYIRYIPKVEEIESEKTTPDNPEYKKWHYSPLSQFSAENYKVYFDTDFTNKNIDIIKAMKLNERYNSLAIKSNGLYILDLKKRYPLSNIKMISDLLAKSKLYISPDQIENDIFHKDNKYALLQKLKNDLLE